MSLLVELMKEKGYWTITEAAGEAGIPYHTLRNWLVARNPKVQSTKKAGKRFVDIASLREYLREET